jgi:hypothetical protein
MWRFFYAGMAEMVDALVLGISGGYPVQVRALVPVQLYVPVVELVYTPYLKCGEPCSCRIEACRGHRIKKED